MSTEQPEQSEVGLLFDAKVRKLYEDRIRELENEQIRIASLVDFEHSKLHAQLEQFTKVVERNSMQLMGDGDTKEGLIEWRRRVDERHKTMIKAVTSIGTVAVSMLLEFVREKLSILLK